MARVEPSEGESTQGVHSEVFKPKPSETVVINVGGHHHEILRSNLTSVPGTLFADVKRLECHFREKSNDYYFDRHPHAFESIVNYLRTGYLHAPTNICGQVFRTEMQFWGVDEFKIEDCCWTRYCSDLEHQKLLQQFQSLKSSDEVMCRNGWDQFKWSASQIFNNPDSSIAAKVYTCISILMILLSIGTFVAESHPASRVDLSTENYVELYNLQNSSHLTDGYIYDYSEYGGDDWYGWYEWFYGSEYNATAYDYTPDAPQHNTSSNWGTIKTNRTVDSTLYIPHRSIVIINKICIVYFTLEIIIRFALSVSKLNFIRRSLNIIDFLAILPFYVDLIVQQTDTTHKYKQSFIDVLFMLQILRIFRIFRLMRQVKGLRILVYTLRHSWKELLLLIFFLIIGMLLFGSLIYFTEHKHKDRHIESILQGFWWAIVTMTTVGYGDVYPQTPLGYAVGSLCSILGIVLLALSVPSLVNNFMLFYDFVHYDKEEKRKEKPKKESKKIEAVKLWTIINVKPPDVVPQVFHSVLCADNDPSTHSDEDQTLNKLYSALDTRGCMQLR